LGREATPALTGDTYEAFYVYLAACFIAALVACNLIFQKFFYFDVPLGGGQTYRIEQSVGMLVYPFTFLVTDILSEIYGEKRASRVVTAGLFASLFTLALVEVSDWVPSTTFGMGDEVFHQVFSASKVGVFASMCAYLAAQYLDVRLFGFWRRVTHGRHLWLRNNGSTIVSQSVDTVVVVAILAAFEVSGINWERAPKLIFDGLIVKWVLSLLDTPLFYLAVLSIRRFFAAKVHELHPDEDPRVI
jgi:uncharacterized integral membrane protein (TIGR00697 family)